MQPNFENTNNPRYRGIEKAQSREEIHANLIQRLGKEIDSLLRQKDAIEDLPAYRKKREDIQEEIDNYTQQKQQLEFKQNPQA